MCDGSVDFVSFDIDPTYMPCAASTKRRRSAAEKRSRTNSRLGSHRSVATSLRLESMDSNANKYRTSSRWSTMKKQLSSLMCASDVAAAFVLLALEPAEAAVKERVYTFDDVRGRGGRRCRLIVPGGRSTGSDRHADVDHRLWRCRSARQRQQFARAADRFGQYRRDSPSMPAPADRPGARPAIWGCNSTAWTTRFTTPAPASSTTPVLLRPAKLRRPIRSLEPGLGQTHVSDLHNASVRLADRQRERWRR